ncbi:GNAT family N-acetyltransferase [Chromobacterium vaccinii]|uniref:GNAT family N-acetyltransferase n=1 Tax=Chromobacterium vaccinii TaxID=1108595 RepID=UPI003C76E370
MIAAGLTTSAGASALAEPFYQTDLRYFGSGRADSLASARHVAAKLFQPHCGLHLMLAERDGGGKDLMKALARHALRYDCRRMDWTAEQGNAAAVDFYRRLGADIVEDKIYYHFAGEALKAFAA